MLGNGGANGSGEVNDLFFGSHLRAQIIVDTPRKAAITAQPEARMIAAMPNSFMCQ